MSTHSPGPWCVDARSGHVMIVSGVAHYVAEVTGAPSNAGTQTDARLISAAPELLRRLKRSIPEGHVYRPDCIWDRGKPCYACDDTEFLRALAEEGGK